MKEVHVVNLEHKATLWFLLLVYIGFYQVLVEAQSSTHFRSLCQWRCMSSHATQSMRKRNAMKLRFDKHGIRHWKALHITTKILTIMNFMCWSVDFLFWQSMRLLVLLVVEGDVPTKVCTNCTMFSCVHRILIEHGSVNYPNASVFSCVRTKWCFDFNMSCDFLYTKICQTFLTERRRRRTEDTQNM